ncbi:MAG: HNH endonuclease [Chloroflexota bacterium]
MSSILRTCPKCKETKPLSEYHKNKQRKNGHACYCKTCVKKYSRRHYRNNREEYLERSRKYKQRTNYDARYYQRNAEKRKRQTKEYYWEDPERWREYALQWQRDNPDKVAARRDRRRARKNGAEGSYTAEEFAELCEMYGNCCLACGSTEDLTADHVVPLSCGGSNSIDNIQPLCRSCNSSKGTNTTDYR